MKKFVKADLEIISFEIVDVITTSLAGDKPGIGEDDEITYN